MSLTKGDLNWGVVAPVGLAIAVVGLGLVACASDGGTSARPAGASKGGRTETPMPPPVSSAVGPVDRMAEAPYPLPPAHSQAGSQGDYPPPPLPTATHAAPFAGRNGSRTFVQTDKRGDGYSVDVPDGWYVWDNGPHFVTLTSYDMSKVVGRGGVPSDLSKYDIRRDPVDAGQSLREEVDAALSGAEDAGSGCEDREVLFREDWVLAGGESAVRYQVKCDSFEYAVLATRIGENAVHLVGYGDLAPFDAIARSLHAAP